MPDLFTALTRDHKEVSHEGGAVFRVTDRVALRRFLVMGSFGSFYVSPTFDAERWKGRVEGIVRSDPHMALAETLNVALGRYAQRRDPALYVLARLMHPDMPLDVRREASESLAEVAVTGTDLLHFMQYRYGSTRKSNRTFRNAVKRWFSSRDAGNLSLQAVKYDSRDKWTMRDVLRLVRPGELADKPMKDRVIDWMAHPDKRMTLPYAPFNFNPREDGALDAARLMTGYSEIRMPHTTPGQAARIIMDRRLPREAVPSDFMEHDEVWKALKVDMPAQAFIRNLGKLSSMGLVNEDDVQRIVRSGEKMHPFAVLTAKAVYDSGHGVKGRLTWPVNRAVSEALEVAFERSFGTLVVDETHLPLVALDVSGSMSGFGDDIITPIMAEAAMAMILAKQYPKATFVTFSGGSPGGWTWSRNGSLSPINIHGQTYRQVLQNISVANGLWGPTEINLPFEQVLNVDIDRTSAIVMTDNETRNKQMAPNIIRRIQQRNPRFRAAVIAFAANEISVLDGNDPLQADFAGMDASLPRLLTMFLDGVLG